MAARAVVANRAGRAPEHRKGLSQSKELIGAVSLRWLDVHQLTSGAGPPDSTKPARDVDHGQDKIGSNTDNVGMCKPLFLAAWVRRPGRAGGGLHGLWLMALLLPGAAASATNATSATGAPALTAPAAVIEPAPNPPDWTEDTPLLARMIERAHAAQVAGELPQAADLYCQAARLGHVDAQYRLGRLLAGSRDGAQRAQGHASLALAAQRGHWPAQQLMQTLAEAGQLLLGGDAPHCQLTGEALALLTPTPTPAEPPAAEAVPHEVVERYVLALPPDKRRHAQLIQILAPRFSVDPRLALAIARAESNFDADAVSPKNAQGLMQLIPDTAVRFGVRNIRDPEQNVRGGLAYLRWLLARFNGDVAMASAAYNAGEGAVDRHGGVPPYAETQEYVKRILRFYRATVHQSPVARR